VKLKETLKGLQSQLEAYKSLGSPEEVNEALDRAFDLANYIRKLEEDTAIKDLSKTYRMSESAVSDMISSIKNISKVEEILKKITEGKKYKVKEDDAPNPDDKTWDVSTEPNVTSEQDDDENPDDDKDKDKIIPPVATEDDDNPDDDKPNPEDELPTPTAEDDDDIQTNPLLMQPTDDKEEDDDNPDDDNPEDDLPIPTAEDDNPAPVASGDDNFDVYVNGDKAFTGTRKECDEYILNSCTDDDNIDVMPVRTESRRVKTKKGKIVEKKSSRISIFEYLVRR
jgi:hypothetical protein